MLDDRIRCLFMEKRRMGEFMLYFLCMDLGFGECMMMLCLSEDLDFVCVIYL